MLRPMTVKRRLCLALSIVAVCSACSSRSDEATYQPLPATVESRPVAIASPGDIAPPPPVRKCATGGRIVADDYPTTVCLLVGAGAQIVLPAFIGLWTKPEVEHGGVVRVRHIRSSRDGYLTFDLEAVKPGRAVVRSHTQPAGDAGTRSAEIRVTVSK